MTRDPDHGDRFRLLVYGRMWQRWAFTCLLIIPASIALWWFAPQIPIISQRVKVLALVPALAAAVIFVYTFIARNFAWVQCRKAHLAIRAPILPLSISYARIRTVRTKSFSQIYEAALQNGIRRQWLEPYLRSPALAVQLKAYPVSKFWLKLWLSPYLLDPDNPELVLVVDDWMGLSRQINDFTNRWLDRRSRSRQRRRS